MEGPTLAPDEWQPPSSMQTTTSRERVLIQPLDPDLSAGCSTVMICPQPSRNRLLVQKDGNPHFFGVRGRDYSLEAENTASHTAGRFNLLTERAMEKASRSGHGEAQKDNIPWKDS